MFFQARLYADMGLQAVYIVLQIYGWYLWLHGGPDRGELRVSRVTAGLILFLATLGIAATLLMGWSLSIYTDADLPYWDSTTTVMSLIAQWMLAKKILENWLVWIGADVLFLGIYYYKELYLTCALYGLFLILAVLGLLAWRKTLPVRAVPEPA